MAQTDIINNQTKQMTKEELIKKLDPDTRSCFWCGARKHKNEMKLSECKSFRMCKNSCYDEVQLAIKDMLTNAKD